jgi:hypothetical protein
MVNDPNNAPEADGLEKNVSDLRSPTRRDDRSLMEIPSVEAPGAGRRTPPRTGGPKKENVARG